MNEPRVDDPTDVNTVTSVDGNSTNGIDQDSTGTRTSVDLKPEDDSSQPASIGSRLFRPHTIISFVVAIAIVFFFVRRLDVDPHEVWRNIRGANIWLYLLALVLYYSSFLLRAIRWRWMLRQAGLSPENGYPIPGNKG